MNRENDIMNMVSHPEHYNMGEVEVIDIIEGLIKDIDDPTVGFNVGSALNISYVVHTKKTCIET